MIAFKFTWSSYFLSLSQTEVVEGWAPLWAGEGLWLVRLGDWEGLRLSLSPRRWLPLLRPPRLKLTPWRELERDLTKTKRDVKTRLFIFTCYKNKSVWRQWDSYLVRLRAEYRLLSRSLSLSLSLSLSRSLSLDRECDRSRLLQEPTPPLPRE